MRQRLDGTCGAQAPTVLPTATKEPAATAAAVVAEASRQASGALSVAAAAAAASKSTVDLPGSAVVEANGTTHPARELEVVPVTPPEVRCGAGTPPHGASRRCLVRGGVGCL